MCVSPVVTLGTGKRSSINSVLQVFDMLIRFQFMYMQVRSCEKQLHKVVYECLGSNPTCKALFVEDLQGAWWIWSPRTASSPTLTAVHWLSDPCLVLSYPHFSIKGVQRSIRLLWGYSQGSKECVAGLFVGDQETKDDLKHKTGDLALHPPCYSWLPPNSVTSCAFLIQGKSESGGIAEVLQGPRRSVLRTLRKGSPRISGDPKPPEWLSSVQDPWTWNSTLWDPG